MATGVVRLGVVVKSAVLVGVLTAWVLTTHRWEGAVVWGFSTDHGVHVGDLVGVALCALIGWRWLR